VKKISNKILTIVLVLAIGVLIIPHLVPDSVMSPTQNTPLDPHKPTLFFFMNPKGTPCLLQKKLLDGVTPQIEQIVNIRFAKVTEDADQELFYKYGIRGLPSLILVDSAGAEIHRFSSGIHQGKTVVDEINATLQQERVTK